MVYQELSLVGPLPVHENIALGREPRRRTLLVDRNRQRRQAAELLASLDAAIDPDALIETLSVAEQQMVEIARAISTRTRVLILDEPTSALSEQETTRLFVAVRSLVDQGVAVIFITHRLEEVRRLADRVVVMRDGAVVADGPRADQDNDDALVKAMVGRTLDRQFPARRRSPGKVMLEVKGLAVPPRVKEIDLSVRCGEIVALAGLVGAGRTEVGRALFGAAPRWTGSISLAGAPVAFRHPHEAVEAGIGWISEDRKGEGLIQSMSVLANLTLPHLDRRAVGGWIDRRSEREMAAAQVKRFRITTAGVDQVVSQLSGGNQQKVALARWLLEECRLLICDEPTRGVDVGGRYEIYEFLEGLASRGVAVLMISSDLPEVLGMADRILVMHEGRLGGELDARTASQEQILRLAMGDIS